MKELKFLYETTIPRLVETSVDETREEDGQKIKITRIVKKANPIKTSILKPDRKLFKAAEMFYAKTLAEYLKAGLMPYSLVAKRYANDGGPLTEKEISRLKELRTESRTLEQEFFSMVGDTKEGKERRNELLVKINAINVEVAGIQNAYSDIFDSSAEMKSRNDTIEWWALFLIYVDEDGKGYKPVFAGETYDERTSKLEEYEDKEDPFFIELIKRMSYLISFWFTARDTVTSIDFGSMEKLWVDTESKYKVVLTEETKIDEVKPSETSPTVEPTIAPTTT